MAGSLSPISFPFTARFEPVFLAVVSRFDALLVAGTPPGRLLGPVPLPRVNPGNTRDAPSTGAGEGEGTTTEATERVTAGTSVSCGNGSVNNTESDVLPLLRRHHSEGHHQGERLRRESSLVSPVGE